jgi:hypothetical protein
MDEPAILRQSLNDGSYILCNEAECCTIKERLKAEIATLTDKQAEYVLRQLTLLLEKEAP